MNSRRNGGLIPLHNTQHNTKETAMLDPYIPSMEDISIELIGPEEAEKYLATNFHNRKVKERKVLQYAADMKKGRWYWNGQTICFDSNNDLVDGQNRLLAVIMSEVVLPFLVVRNVERKAQETIDTGAARTFADALKLRGEQHWNLLAGIVTLIATYEQQDRDLRSQFARPSIQTLMDTFNQHSWIRDMATNISRWSRTTPLSPSVIGFLTWLLTPLDNVDAEFFFQRLADGAELPENHPILVLRTTLQNHREMRFSKLDPRTQTAMTIKAWNKYRDGAPATPGSIRWRQGGAKPETFPIPR